MVLLSGEDGKKASINHRVENKRNNSQFALIQQQNEQPTHETKRPHALYDSCCSTLRSLGEGKFFIPSSILKAEPLE